MTPTLGFRGQTLVIVAAMSWVSYEQSACSTVIFNMSKDIPLSLLFGLCPFSALRRRCSPDGSKIRAYKYPGLAF